MSGGRRRDDQRLLKGRGNLDVARLVRVEAVGAADEGPGTEGAEGACDLRAVLLGDCRDQPVEPNLTKSRHWRSLEDEVPERLSSCRVRGADVAVRQRVVVGHRDDHGIWPGSLAQLGQNRRS